MKISYGPQPFIQPYAPKTWRTPADAMVTRFYDWAADEGHRHPTGPNGGQHQWHAG
ncbi:hypothetical protein GCM10009574_074450 [Streptomyces asiaticus]|uniref:Uncharacterized protein n=2 Tax=Streptomyces rhizosphaericus TaxID=114699 RepID=A0ABN1P1J4_9ACTN